jgi:CBS domain-containing protein
MKALKVKDLMTKDVITVFPDMTVKEAANVLYKRKISGLPVVDPEKRLVGMITEKDIIKMALPTYFDNVGSLSFLPSFELFDEKLARADKVLVKEVMRKEVITTTEDENIVEVARLMVIKLARRIPVLREGKLIGIISRSDIVREMEKRSGIIKEGK